MCELASLFIGCAHFENRTGWDAFQWRLAFDLVKYSTPRRRRLWLKFSRTLICRPFMMGAVIGTPNQMHADPLRLVILSIIQRANRQHATSNAIVSRQSDDARERACVQNYWLNAVVIFRMTRARRQNKMKKRIIKTSADRLDSTGLTHNAHSNRKLWLVVIMFCILFLSFFACCCARMLFLRRLRRY